MKYHFAIILTLLTLLTALHAELDQPTSNLFKACKLNNKELVQKSLADGGDINAIDDKGCSPIFYAVENKNTGIIDALLNQGTEIDLSDSAGIALMCRVVEYGNLDILKKLVEHGGDIHRRHRISEYQQYTFVKNGTGTLLHVAVTCNHPEIVLYLLDEKLDIEARNTKGFSPLFVAATEGNMDMVKLLIKHGANIYSGTEHKKILLSTEPYSIPQRILSYLLQVEKEKNLANWTLPGWAPYIQKDLHSNTISLRDIESYINSGGDPMGRDSLGNTLLHYLAGMNLHNNKILTHFLETLKFNVDDANYYGETPLHISSKEKETENVKILLDHQADTEIQDKDGNTALNSLASYKTFYTQPATDALAIAKMLLNKNADVNTQNAFGQTPLFRFTHPNLVKMMLEHKADVSIRDNSLKTALHKAGRENIQKIKLLLEAGAAVDITDIHGRTILQKVQYDTQEKYDLLFKYKKKSNVVEAASYSQDSLLRDLVRNGESIDTPDCCYYYSETPLMIATRKNNLKIVKTIIELNADLNIQSNTGNTATHHAAKWGHNDILALLLASGADVNIRNKDGQTAYEVAKSNGKYRSVQLFKDIYPDIELRIKDDAQNEKKNAVKQPAPKKPVAEKMSEEEMKAIAIKSLSEQTDKPLHKAVILGEIETVRNILQNKDTDVNAMDKLDSTPLMYAVYMGNTEIVELLLKHNADVNIKNKHGMTSLIAAIYGGDKEVVTLLLDSRADPSIGEMNALEAAKLTQRAEIAKMLQEKFPDLKADDKKFFFGNVQEKNDISEIDFEEEARLQQLKWKKDEYLANSDSPLHIAAIKGELKKVKQSATKENINKVDASGMLPIAYAAIFSHKQVVDYLIDNGAEINLVDSSKDNYFMHHNIGTETGWGLLHHLLACGNVEMLKYMTSKGADVNVIDKEHGRPPIFLLIHFDNKQAAEILVKAGADFTLMDKMGDTVLHYTEYHKSLSVLKKLLDLGADWQTPDKAGKNILCYAARRDHTESLKFLIDYGIDIDQQDKAGRTALMHAASLAEYDTMVFLIEKGADIDHLDKAGNNLLHLAASRKDNLEAIRICLEYGIDVNHKNIAETTPVFNTLGSSRYSTRRDDKLLNNIKMLIEAGADISSKNKKGNTLLHIASSRYSPDFVKFIIEHGADVNATNNQELTPIQLLNPHIKFGEPFEVLKLLVDNGANPDVLNLQGRTPLHTVVLARKLEETKYLISKGADVNLTADNLGDTPLHSMVKAGNTEFTELLLAARARKDIKNVKGLTAEDIVIISKSKRLLKLFESTQ